MGSFPGSPINNTVHCGNSFHFEKSPGPLWGEIISPDNGLDLLNAVKLTAAKQLRYSSEGKRALGPWKKLGKGNRASAPLMRGNQNAPRVESEIPASSAFSNQTYHQRKKPGESHGGQGWCLLSVYVPGPVLSHLHALFNRLLTPTR